MVQKGVSLCLNHLKEQLPTTLRKRNGKHTKPLMDWDSQGVSLYTNPLQGLELPPSTWPHLVQRALVDAVEPAELALTQHGTPGGSG